MFPLRSVLSRTGFSIDILEGNAMKKVLLGTLSVAAIIVAASALIIFLRGGTPVNSATISINGQTIYAEVVSTESAREKGLGGRNGIALDGGMLFAFDGPRLHGIWMKDMQFPIDIVWMAGGKIVSIEENVDPQIGASASELTTYFPETYDDSVLELHAGRAKTLGAHTGDTVTIINNATR